MVVAFSVFHYVGFILILFGLWEFCFADLVRGALIFVVGFAITQVADLLAGDEEQE